MSLLNSLIAQVAGNVDIANLAGKVGIDPSVAEMAVTALASAHHEDGDTVALAADKTGLSTDVLSQIVGHIGGEGSLGEFANILKNNPTIVNSVMGTLDKDGDGNPINDIAGFAAGLFGKK